MDRFILVYIYIYMYISFTFTFPSKVFVNTKNESRQEGKSCGVERMSCGAVAQLRYDGCATGV